MAETSMLNSPAAGIAAPVTASLILGIGNSLLADEGIGVHVLDALRRRTDLPPGATLVEGGTLSFTLVSAFEGAAALVVVDAAELGAAPGAVRVFEGEGMDGFLNSRRRRSVHEVGLMDLMDIARLEGLLPHERALVGIQPASLGWGTGPSEAVEAAIPEACQRVMALVEGWHGR